MPRNFFNKVIAADKPISVTRNSTKDPIPSNAVRTNRSNTMKINGAELRKELDFEELKLKGIDIMFFAEEELRKIAINITKEKKDDNTRETISDQRMFPARGKLSSMDELPGDFTPGYLGRIDLGYPIINAWGREYLINILKSICYKCGSLLLDKDTVKRTVRGAENLRTLAMMSIHMPCRNISCPSYGLNNPKFQSGRASNAKIELTFSNETTEEFTTVQIVNVLKNITKDELEALGFSQSGPFYKNPVNMIFRSLAVIPESHRPPRISESKTIDNQLTVDYQKIIHTNNSIKLGNNDDQKGVDALDLYISSIFTREPDKSGVSNPNAEDSKNIKELISKKKGLIRGNIQAKRVDGTARTVIGPGGLDIPFGYIRIPEVMTKMKVSEIICDSNREYYQNHLEGSMVKIDGQIKDPSVKEIELKNGMIVLRPIKDGDVLLANRNPTLYKHSMMGYRVKIDKGLTIGLHSSNTKHHNADFDGDEMNLGVTPGYEARAEIKYIAGCWNQIIGSQFSRPMMGLLINGVTGSYLISKYGKVSNEMFHSLTQDFHDLDNRVDNLRQRYNKYYPEKSDWLDGKALFSLLLPENFYYNRGSSKVKIVNGILESGVLTNSQVGPSTSSIPHEIFKLYGKHFTARFINEGQSLADRFLEYVGFTVGYRDSAMPTEESKVKDIVDSQINIAETKITQLTPLRRSPKLELRDFYEQSVQEALDTIKNLGQEIVKNALDDSNSLKVMANAGSKGSATDIAQVIGVVGQQFIKDKRPELRFNVNPDTWEGRRFLPHYDISHEGYSEKIRNRGFVDRALGKGLTPGQLVAHMMPTRNNLIDTALGTADTGYTHRTITQALEDIRCGYNTTICDDLGRVTQFSLGYDSYDPTHVNEINIPGYGKTWSPFDVENIVNMLNNSN